MTDTAAARSARYPVRINLTERQSVYTHLFEMIRPGTSVLDVGGAAGDLGVLLRSRGCRTTVIEANGADALRAAEVCDRVIVGDVETVDLREALGDERFDAIVLADVLEHLRDPAATLACVSHYVAPDGAVLASIPNVAHAAVRLQLMAGRWEYTPTGLLDRTHLRFFTRASVERLFEETGLRIAEMRRIELDAFDTEIPIDREACPRGTLEWLAGDPDARTYQFIVRALAHERPPGVVVGDGVRVAPAAPSPTDLANARRQALERLEIEAAARDLALNRQIWALEQEVLGLKQRAIAADVAEGELRVIKASGTYRLARTLSHILRSLRSRPWRFSRASGGSRGD